MRAPDPVMLLLHRFEGMGKMIDLNAGAQRIYEASDCLEREEKPGVEAALKHASEAANARLSNAQIELFGMRATPSPPPLAVLVETSLGNGAA